MAHFFNKERRQAVFKLLNTPLALLILSSVILTGIGRLYSNWQAANVRRQSAHVELTNLTSELSFRAKNIEMAMHDLDDGEPTACHRIWQIAVGDDRYHPALPEFKNTHIIGLLIRARPYVHVPGADSKISRAADGALVLQRDTELRPCNSSVEPILRRDVGLLLPGILAVNDELHLEMQARGI